MDSSTSEIGSIENQRVAPLGRQTWEIVPTDADHGPGARIAIAFSALIGVAVIASGCGYLGYYSAFFGSQPYDDEGMMLCILNGLVKGGRMYDEVTSLYGPVGFLPKLALVRLFSIPVTHDTGRLFALVYWYLGAATCAVAIGRMTRSLVWMSIAGGVAFLTLCGISLEPGHPQDACALLLGAAVLLSTFRCDRRWAQIAIGGVAGLLCLTKINLGVFCAAALWGAIAFQLRPSILRKVMIAVCLLGFLSGPFVLMRNRLAFPWVQGYAVLVSSSLLACLITALVRKVGRTAEPRNLLWTTVGFFSSIGIVCLVVLTQGTSAKGLVEGIFLLPLRMSETSVAPFKYIYSPAVPATGFAVTMILLWLRRAASHWLLCTAIAVVRLGGGLAAIYCAMGNEVQRGNVLALAPFLMPLLLFPGAGADPKYETEIWPRLFLAFVAVLEALWAFPVAGSQVFFSTTLLAVAACLLARDGIEELCLLMARTGATKTAIRWLRHGAALGVLLMTACSLWEMELSAEFTYGRGIPLALPGCDRIRVHPAWAWRYQTVVAQLKLNAGSLFVVPGECSYYFWTGLPPLTGRNITDWMELLTREQQEEIIEALRRCDRPCIVLDPLMMNFWLAGRPLSSPLMSFIEKEFQPAYQLSKEDLKILVRRDRKTFIIADGSRQDERLLTPPPTERSKSR